MIKSILSLTLVFSMVFGFVPRCVSLNVSAAVVDEPVAQIQTILLDGAIVNDAIVDRIQLKRANGTTEPAKIGALLFEKDEITTGQGVSVNLRFTKANSEDQIDVQVQEKSSARIGSLYTLFGRFFISGWGTFDTKTSYVRLGKRGTEFQVDVAADGSADVKVLRGEVEVEECE